MESLMAKSLNAQVLLRKYLYYQDSITIITDQVHECVKN